MEFEQYTARAKDCLQSAQTMARSCTWPLRVNTSDSPVDHPKIKKA